jgi:hypothetical protein
MPYIAYHRTAAATRATGLASKEDKNSMHGLRRVHQHAKGQIYMRIPLREETGR